MPPSHIFSYAEIPRKHGDSAVVLPHIVQIVQNIQEPLTPGRALLTWKCIMGECWKEAEVWQAALG